MSITIKQVCKVLDSAEIKYSKTSFSILIYGNDAVFLNWHISHIDNILIFKTDNNISFKFNSLAYDDHNLYFSYRGGEPLIVRINKGV